MSLRKGPYENHYYALGEPIRNIVKQGQELLCAVRAGVFYQDLLSARDYYDSLYASWTHINNPENGKTLWAIDKSRVNTAYPQSLGELCIELAQDKYLRWQIDIDYGLLWMPSQDPERDNGLRNPDDVIGLGAETRSDIQALRELLHHKRT